MTELTLKNQIDALAESLDSGDFLYLNSSQVMDLLGGINGAPVDRDEVFLDSWNTLENDQYMADSGRYRKRRHATYATQFNGDTPALMPHQPHYQTLDYNHLNGGVARYFAPIVDDIHQSPTLSALLTLGNNLFSKMVGNGQWHIELHQFRIEARDGSVGKPTPEGVHRDGVDFVIVVMIKRVNIESGATTIYNLDNELVGEFTLLQTFDMVLVNDRKVYHGVTPITQLNPDEEAYRDVLVITFRQKEAG